MLLILHTRLDRHEALGRQMYKVGSLALDQVGFDRTRLSLSEKSQSIDT